MGEVYRGVDTRLGRAVALKVISQAAGRRRGQPSAFRNRSTRRLGAQPSGHRHHLRRRRGRRPVVDCHGARRGPHAPRGDRGRPPVDPGGVVDCQAMCRRPRRRPCQRHRAPRSETRERDADPRGRRQDSRFRRRPPRRRHIRQGAVARHGHGRRHSRRNHSRNRRLHVPRAGDGTEHRLQIRPVLVRRRHLRAARRPARVPASDGRRDTVCHPP